MTTTNYLATNAVETEAATIGRLAQDAQAAQDLGLGGAYVIRGQVIDLEAYLDQPRAARGSIELHDATSLATYVNRHQAAGTVLFADLEARRIVAILNHHAAEAIPAWGDHRAGVTFATTNAWDHWTGADGKLLDQATFAQHVEDGLTELIEPTGADMLEVAQSIEATTTGEFASAERLANGQRRFTYRETIEARAGQAGHLTIPETLTLGIPVLDGQTDAYRLTARFRYRITNGRLSLGYRLDRPRDVLRAAVWDEVARVEEATSLVALRGIAPAALR